MLEARCFLRSACLGLASDRQVAPRKARLEIDLVPAPGCPLHEARDSVDDRSHEPAAVRPQRVGELEGEGRPRAGERLDLHYLEARLLEQVLEAVRRVAEE